MKIFENESIISCLQATLNTSIEDWQIDSRPKFIDDAKLQGVDSLIYYYLSKSSKLNKIPIQSQIEFKKAFMNALGRNIALFEDLKELLTTLNNAGIQAIVLKGPALIETIYKDMGARWIGDIDILVREKDLFHAQDCLLANGYLQDFNEGKHVKLEDSHHLLGLRSRKQGIKIELHWSINVAEMFKIDTDHLFERAVSCNFDGIDALILSPMDTLLHICQHHYHGHLEGLILKHVYDIAAVVHRYRNEIDWRQFIKRCEEYNTTTTTYLALKLARNLLNKNFPDEILEALETKSDADQIATYKIRSQIHDKSISNLFLFENNSDKLKYFIRKIFPQRSFLIHRYSLPKNSKRIYFYYLVRPFQLVKDHLLKAMKLFILFNRSKFRKNIQPI